MKLDLRIQGKLDLRIAIQWNEIAKEVRQPFTNLIQRLSESNKDNLDWCAVGPASRSIFISPLFHYYCAIVLVDMLIAHEDPIS